MFIFLFKSYDLCLFGGQRAPNHRWLFKKDEPLNIAYFLS